MAELHEANATIVYRAATFLRSELRHEWNRPVVWPAWVLGATVIALIVPGIRTFYRERQ